MAKSTELLELEIEASKTKIELIDMTLKDGTIEQKIDLILKDIKEREVIRKCENERELKMAAMMDCFYKASTNRKEEDCGGLATDNKTNELFSE